MTIVVYFLPVKHLNGAETAFAELSESLHLQAKRGTSSQSQT